MAERYVTHLPLLPGAVDDGSPARRSLAARAGLVVTPAPDRHRVERRRRPHLVLRSDGLDRRGGRGQTVTAGVSAVVAALGTDAGRTVAIEDSSNGLRSASAAGLRVIAVPHPAFPPAPDALALATTVVSDLSAITVDLVGSLA